MRLSLCFANRSEIGKNGLGTRWKDCFEKERSPPNLDEVSVCVPAMTSVGAHTLQTLVTSHRDAMDQGHLHSQSFSLARLLFNQRCGENFQVNQKM